MRCRVVMGNRDMRAEEQGREEQSPSRHDVAGLSSSLRRHSWEPTWQESGQQITLHRTHRRGCHWRKLRREGSAALSEKSHCRLSRGAGGSRWADKWVTTALIIKIKSYNPWFVAFASFQGVNPPTMANFKLSKQNTVLGRDAPGRLSEASCFYHTLVGGHRPLSDWPQPLP